MFDIIIQRLNDLSEWKNQIILNSKKIFQLPVATDGTKYVPVHNETSLETEKFNLTEALNGFNLLNDKITAFGTISREDDTFSFSLGYEWTINGLNYANTEIIDLTISAATTDFYRIDIAVVDTNNEIYLIEGFESDTIAEQPQTPPNTLLLAVFNIFGTQIEEPNIPQTGTREVKIINYGAVYTITQSDDNKFLVLKSDLDLMLPLGLQDNTEIIGFNDSEFTREIIFDTGIEFLGNPIVPHDAKFYLKKIELLGGLERWAVSVIGGGDFVLKTGDTMSGPLVIDNPVYGDDTAIIFSVESNQNTTITSGGTLTAKRLVTDIIIDTNGGIQTPDSYLKFEVGAGEDHWKPNRIIRYGSAQTFTNDRDLVDKGFVIANAGGGDGLLYIENTEKTDFLNNTGTFTSTSVGGGSYDYSSENIQYNKGIWIFKSSGSANSGYVSYSSDFTATNLIHTSIIKMPSTIDSNTIIKCGLLDGIFSLNEFSACIFKIAGDQLKARNVDGFSATESSAFTLTANTWYRLVINCENMSSINYKVYANNSNTILFEVNLTTNIPSSSATLKNLIQAYNTSTFSGNLVHADYLAHTYKRILR